MVKIFHADDPKSWAHIITGLLLLALGLIPFLNNFGLIGFGLPGFLVTFVPKFALWLIAAVGLWLIIDGFMEDHAVRNVTLIVAAVFLAIGVLQLLNNFGYIGFSIPFLSLNVYYAIFAIEGLFLLIATFATW